MEKKAQHLLMLDIHLRLCENSVELNAALLNESAITRDQSLSHIFLSNILPKLIYGIVGFVLNYSCACIPIFLHIKNAYRTYKNFAIQMHLLNHKKLSGRR